MSSALQIKQMCTANLHGILSMGNQKRCLTPLQTDNTSQAKVSDKDIS